jgi:hypothetical protein
MIKLLDSSEWHKLEPIFESEWGACLPDPAHGNIIVDIDDDELRGFFMAESLIRVGNFYTAPNHRGGKVPLGLIRHMEQIAPRSQRSFVAFADEERFEPLFERLKMRRVGMAYRKDFQLGGD